MTSPARPGTSLVTDPAYAGLKEHVIGATGLEYYADKDGDLAGHLAGRLAHHGLNGCAAYLALLTEGPGAESALDALIEDLTIGETFFFRHETMFDALRDVLLPERLERNRASRQLRIWSAGCATGAEAYSVAIVLRRDLGHLLAGWDVTIVGTDINRSFLAQAREGRFDEWALRGMPDAVKRACFTQSGKSWLLAPHYKEGVYFQYHNLVRHPFPSLVNNLFGFDVILCRNVTIYFNQEIVRQIVGHFHHSLAEGGWLLVGHSEPSTQVFTAFQTVNVPGAVLYQKSTVLPNSSMWPPLATPTEPLPPATAAMQWSPPLLHEEAAPAPAESDVTKNGAPPQAVTEPASPDVNAIRALADCGAWDDALRQCDAALHGDKLNPLLHFYEALIFDHLGRHAETESALRRAIYLDRRFVLAHYYLGLHVQMTDRPRQAARSFHNVLQLLAVAPAGQVFAHADGITAAELEKLTRHHLEVLEGA